MLNHKQKFCRITANNCMCQNDNHIVYNIQVDLILQCNTLYQLSYKTIQHNLWYSSSTLYQLSYKTIQLTTFDTAVNCSSTLYQMSYKTIQHNIWYYCLWYSSSTLYQLNYKTIQLTTFDTLVQHSINWTTRPSNSQPLIL